jgi:hypothetical protein
MKAISCSVTARPYKTTGLSWTMWELINTEEDFKEDARNANWMRVRAISTIWSLDWVRHVRLVIRSIEILSIPAHREPHLRAKAIFAHSFIGGESWGFSSWSSSKACVGDSSFLDVAVVVRPSPRASRSHSEAWRESLKVWGILSRLVATATEVIHCESSVWDQRQATVGPLIVQI